MAAISNLMGCQYHRIGHLSNYSIYTTISGSCQMCLPGLNFGEFHEIICLNMVVIGLLASAVIATLWICCCPCATYNICCKSDKPDEEISSKRRRKDEKKRKREGALTTPLLQKNANTLFQKKILFQKKKEMSKRPLLL